MVKQAYWREFCSPGTLPSTADSINLCLLQRLYVWACFSPQYSRKWWHGTNLSAKHSSVSIPALLKPTGVLFYIMHQLQMSLNSFPNPLDYGIRKSRAQGLSWLLIALSFRCFICKTGVRISTMPNSQDCESQNKMMHLKALCKPPNTMQTLLLLWCSYPANLVLGHPSAALQLSHTKLWPFPGSECLSWCHASAWWGESGPEARLPGTWMIVVLAYGTVRRIKWVTGIKSLGQWPTHSKCYVSAPSCCHSWPCCGMCSSYPSLRASQF